MDNIQFWQMMNAISRVDPRFHETIIFWLDEIDSDNSVLVYQGHLLKFFIYFHSRKKEYPSLALIDRRMLRMFFSELKRKPTTKGTPISSAYRAAIHSSLNSLFEFCFHEELISQNPMQNMKRPKVKSKPVRHLTLEETRLFISKFKKKFEDSQLDKSARNRRDSFMRYTMVYMYLSVGLRSSELANLKLKDCSNSSEKPFIEITKKGGETIFEPIPASAAELLQRWINKHRLRSDPNDYVFVYKHAKDRKIPSSTIRNFITREAKAMGIKKNITTHSLKASYLTRLDNQGATIGQLKLAGKHAKAETTLSYIHRNSNEKHEITEKFDIADIL